MPSILVVTLICASSLAAKDCTRDTAQDVITHPAHSPQECMLLGPAIAAGSGRGTEAGTYVKTLCERRR
ncbi:hypothetical protein [Methylobacterium frigidaeris]|uniref:Ribosomal protein S27 n=1 Tax=Methylobacterium frigidaeris TaxID=2038277 RepID=A0AA37HDE8_9HYPH|nr:hypothetical protein [Methylobacterium frigidaeris]PIK72577.1 hypothetical protein CS379_13185 [Methylobacterium frigidaeris]GJD63643.1 hypothetical protein MPEAHAMD_3813 [Methylobacterium frigidaeris]